MATRSLDIPEATELPGFFRDPSTGRYFAIPTNPSTGVQAIFTAAAQNAREKSSFNKIPIQIKIDKKFGKQNIYRGLPGILNAQQNGSISAGNFSSHVTKLKLRQLEISNQGKEAFKVTSRFPGPVTCKFVICFDDFHVGSWYVNPDTEVSSIKRTFRNRTDDSLPSHVITRISQKRIAIIHETVVHMCPAELRNKKYILMCTNSRDGSSSANHLIPVYRSRVPGRIRTSFLIRIRSLMRCCAWNDKQKVIAIGLDNDIMIHTLQNDKLSFLKFPCQDYKVVELSNDGDILFTVNRDELVSRDLRTEDIINLTKIGRGVEYMKILKDNYTLITSGYDNLLSNVDLRMGKVVFKYPGFNNKHRKIPFTYDETRNVLCSAGQDNVTRYWNLRSGEPFASLNPPVESQDQVNSFLSVQDNVLTTSIFVENKVFYY